MHAYIECRSEGASEMRSRSTLFRPFQERNVGPSLAGLPWLAWHVDLLEVRRNRAGENEACSLPIGLLLFSLDVVLYYSVKRARSKKNQ